MIIRALFVITVLSLGAVTCSAATFSVNSTVDSYDASPGNGVCADSLGRCTLRAAIKEANTLAGADTINVPAGTYTQTLHSEFHDDQNWYDDWDITGNLTINGAGSGSTIVQAATSPGIAYSRVFDILSGSVTITGVTFRNGYYYGTISTSSWGGGIRNYGSLTLNSCSVTDNEVRSTTGAGNPVGGGILNYGAYLRINNSTITNNRSRQANGGCSGCSIYSGAYGGGIASVTVGAVVSITNSSINSNSVTSSPAGYGAGGGMYFENRFDVTIQGSHFDYNTANAMAGGRGTGIMVWASVGASVMHLNSSTVNGNASIAGSASYGGGMQISTFPGSTATFLIDGSLNAISGNAIYNNNGYGGGVGLLASGGKIDYYLSYGTISSNTGAAFGGGMFADNGPTGTGYVSGGVGNSTISGNTAVQSGGGLEIRQSNTTTAANVLNFSFCTIARNNANTDLAGTEGGGGIKESGYAEPILWGSVVGDNTAGGAGQGQDVNGQVVANYSHVETTSPWTSFVVTMGPPVTTGDPQLGVLANNGGSTLTHLPSASSPLVNTVPYGTIGCGNYYYLDQRFFSRISTCDKGSVER